MNWPRKGCSTIMGYPSFRCWFQDCFDQVSRLGDLMGEHSLVSAEGGGVHLHSRVNLDSDGLASLFDH